MRYNLVARGEDIRCTLGVSNAEFRTSTVQDSPSRPRMDEERSEGGTSIASDGYNVHSYCTIQHRENQTLSRRENVTYISLSRLLLLLVPRLLHSYHTLGVGIGVGVPARTK